MTRIKITTMAKLLTMMPIMPAADAPASSRSILDGLPTAEDTKTCLIGNVRNKD